MGEPKLCFRDERSAARVTLDSDPNSLKYEFKFRFFGYQI